MQHNDRDLIKVSLAGRVAEAILNDYIRVSALKTGGRLPSIKGLVERYGVSRPTICQALDILEEQGVIRKRQGSGSFVVRPPEMERQSTSRLIGYVAPVVDCELSWRLYRGLRSTCAARGYGLLHASPHGDYDNEHTAITNLVNSGCEAVVLMPVTRTPEQLANDFVNTNFTDRPIILVGSAAPQQRRHQLVFDNYGAGRAMTRYLLDRGHRRIGFITMEDRAGGRSFTAVDERFRGYLDALAGAGAPYYPEDRWLIDHLPTAPARGNSAISHDANLSTFAAAILPALSRWQRVSERPTALLTVEDNRAARLVRVCGRLGIRVKEDLEIAGFDNTILGRMCDPPFVTTDPDFTRMGELAADLAINEIRSPSAQLRSYVLPAPILNRSSFSDDVQAQIAAEGSVALDPELFHTD